MGDLPAGTVTMLFSPGEARDMLAGEFDYLASSCNTFMLVNALELAAAIAAALGDPLRVARLAGAAEAIRQESGLLITPQEAAMFEELLAPARATVTAQEWDAELAAGRSLSQPEALVLLLSLSPAPTRPPRFTRSSGVLLARSSPSVPLSDRGS